jgi:hypothetical protein
MKKAKRIVIRKRPGEVPPHISWGCNAIFTSTNNVNRFVLRKKLPIFLHELAKAEGQTIYYYDTPEPRRYKDEGFLLHVYIAGVEYQDSE